MTVARAPIPSAAGIGLRFRHHDEVAETRPAVAWLEVHTENYLGGSAPVRCLERIRRDYPISLHGIGLSLGSAEGLDPAHLGRIAGAASRFAPGLVSEHLSWSIVDGHCLADLLPLPMTEEALDVVCRHVEETQLRLRRQILVENPSTYLRWHHSTIPEWEFLAEVARRTGCGILCDVNNIFVSCANHGWDAHAYLAALPAAAIGEIHLAGHSVRTLDDGRSIRIDDHGSRVITEVWNLCVRALARFGAVPSAIEWDTDVPPLRVLLDEAARAERHLDRVRRGRLVPTLLAIERAVARSILGRDDGLACPTSLPPGARLAVYRNTFIDKLTRALRLSYPAVHRLVGADFFDGAARVFIDREPPRNPDLDTYGETFAEFLAGFAPAAALPYLAGVARLEWALARALHAPDVPPLDLRRLAAVDDADRGRIAFLPHPSIGLVVADHPVDAVRRAVIARDEAAMAAIDLAGGSVRLLVERRDDGVAVSRLDEAEWSFAAILFASKPLAAAIAATPDIEAAPFLAEHLAAGRVTDFSLVDAGSESNR